jgi:hypothetical protein
MSRIILRKYGNGQERIVVGWDHPCGGAFWQEFALEPAGEDEHLQDGEEVIREGGFFPGIPYDDFKAAVPDDLRPLLTDHVMKLLLAHAEDPDSGYNAESIDLTEIP